MSVTQGFQTKLQYNSTPSPSGSSGWTDFAQIVSIKPPPLECKDIETSVMDSPEQWDTYVAGWANANAAELKIQFEKAQHATVIGLFRQNLGFRVVFPDATSPSTLGSTLAWVGYLKKIQGEVEREGITQVDVEIKVSGKPIFTPAA